MMTMMMMTNVKNDGPKL